MMMNRLLTMFLVAWGFFIPAMLNGDQLKEVISRLETLDFAGSKEVIEALESVAGNFGGDGNEIGLTTVDSIRRVQVVAVPFLSSTRYTEWPKLEERLRALEIELEGFRVRHADKLSLSKSSGKEKGADEQKVLPEEKKDTNDLLDVTIKEEDSKDDEDSKGNKDTDDGLEGLNLDDVSSASSSDSKDKSSKSEPSGDTSGAIVQDIPPASPVVEPIGVTAEPTAVGVPVIPPATASEAKAEAPVEPSSEKPLDEVVPAPPAPVAPAASEAAAQSAAPATSSVEAPVTVASGDQPASGADVAVPEVPVPSAGAPVVAGPAVIGDAMAEVPAMPIPAATSMPDMPVASSGSEEGLGLPDMPEEDIPA